MEGGDHTLSDFDLITHKFPSRNDITIYPIADVHLGAPECMQSEWERFCQMVRNDPTAYVVLGGDLIDNATKGSVGNVYEARMRPAEAKRLMANMLEPIRDRILCAVTGNHERRSSKDVDDDPVYDIMTKLDLEDVYRENIAFVRIQMGEPRGYGKTNPTYILVVAHGSGGGGLTGSAVNRGERFGYVLDGADVLIIGHTHKPFVTQPTKIKIDAQHGYVRLRPFKVISATSWLEYGGYAAQKLLLPSSHCLHSITLCGKRKEMVVSM